jgi:hypothetical protein
MFDEEKFFSMGDAAAESVARWHQQHQVLISEPMALLLTELERPEWLAAQVNAHLDAEAAPLLRLLTEHDRMMTRWKAENPNYDEQRAELRNASPGGSKGKEAWLKLNPPPFQKERKVLEEALTKIKQQRDACKSRAAARRKDIEAGKKSRTVDPAEEDDPIAGIAARRAREKIDEKKNQLDERSMINNGLRKILNIRTKKK